MTKMLHGDWKTGDYVNFTCKYIEEHYMENIQLSDIAIVAHVSASYLSTRFKKETGMNFTEYLVRFRINKAEELLKESNMRCREIAEKVGYFDYAHFSKIFKKYNGMSPRAYQESCRDAKIHVSAYTH